MSRRRNCWDNAVAESFFSSLKQDRIQKRIYRVRQLRRGMTPQTATGRIPAGHLKGCFEAFSELHRDFSRARRGEANTHMPGLPKGQDG